MDLKWIECELDSLSTLWEELRCKRPRFPEEEEKDPAATTTIVTVATTTTTTMQSLSAHMLSWNDLLSRTAPPIIQEEEEVLVVDAGGSMTETTCDNGNNDNVVMESVNATSPTFHSKNTAIMVTTTTTTTATTIIGDSNESMEDEHDDNNHSCAVVDYEFGMCLGTAAAGDRKVASSSTDNKSVWDKYANKELSSSSFASKNQQALPENGKKKHPVDEGKDEINIIMVTNNNEEDAVPEKILNDLIALRERWQAIAPKIEKLRKKSMERDLVTKVPRFGKKTMERVKGVIHSYEALTLGICMSLDDSSSTNSTTTFGRIISTLRSHIQQHNTKLERFTHARKLREEAQADWVTLEAIRAKDVERERIRLADSARRKEEEILAQRAREARMRRMAEEQAAEDAVRAADRELIASVPNLGPDGVREQILRMKTALRRDDNNDEGCKKMLSIALTSLRDMFLQIVRHPEEVKYRTVRRDHPKFIENIGRHIGGREILIAAGFRLEHVEGVPCLYSKEPNVEVDMDGWSDWFENLKKTLHVIEDEMID